MFNKVLRTAITALGGCGGLALTAYLDMVAKDHMYFGVDFIKTLWFQWTFSIITILLCSLIAFWLSKPIIAFFIKTEKSFDTWQSDKSISDLYISVVALLLGLVIAYLLGNLTRTIPSAVASFTVSVITYLVCPYITVRFMWKRRRDIKNSPLFKRNANIEQTSTEQAQNKTESETQCVKILDASAIIDGRVYDMGRLGFIDGKIIVPTFVINELGHLADNGDSIKRKRGRRGLDILKQLQDLNTALVELCDTDYMDISETDTKLIRLALERKAAIITTDYNLSKAAAVHNVRALNMNELTNAVKTVLLPGEELVVSIIKEGKEQNQGLAYLEDGTMIVIENGKYRVGEKCTVCVTSVLQTSAGRMIFATVCD